MRGRPIKGSDIHPEEVVMLCQGNEVYGIGSVQKLYARHLPGLNFVCLSKGPMLKWLQNNGCRVDLVEGLAQFTARGSINTLMQLPGSMARAHRDARRIHQLLKGRGVRVVHTHWLPQQLIAGCMRKYGYRSVWQIHNKMNPGRLFSLGIKLNHLLARWGTDLLLPVSHFIARNWRGSGVRIHTVHNAATPFFECVNSLSPTPIRCISAGRLTASKGHHLAVDAVIAARLAGHDVLLDIVGGPLEDSEYARSIRERATVTGDSQAIRLIGFKKDLRHTHQDYHLGLQCSIEPESCSMWVCETMVDGLPVIASATGGTPELIEDDKTGLLFKSQDVEELTQKLIGLAKDPDRLNQMRSAAFARGREHFSLDRFVSQTLEGYTQICEGNLPPT